MDKKWDPDISAMGLTDPEKNGLQMYRNYSRAFEKHRRSLLVEEIDRLPWDVGVLNRLNELILNEDARTITVIVCAFMDDQLHEMYKRELPDGIPGGRGQLLEGFGPLSRFAQRIQIAFAFNWVSKDLLQDAYRLRKMRNDISHRWNIDELKPKLDEFVRNSISPVESYFEEDQELPKDFHKNLDHIDVFRFRLLWITGRFYYECWAYPKITKAGLDQCKVLYLDRPMPKFLSSVASACNGATTRLVSKAGVSTKRI